MRARDPERGQRPAPLRARRPSSRPRPRKAGLNSWPKLEVQRPGRRPEGVPGPSLALLPQAAPAPKLVFRPCLPRLFRYFKRIRSAVGYPKPPNTGVTFWTPFWSEILLSPLNRSAAVVASLRQQQRQPHPHPTPMHA